MISVRIKNLDSVKRSTKRTAEEIMDGLEVGVSALDEVMAQQAADKHVQFTESQRGHGATKRRAKNKDGSHRFFSRTGAAAGSIKGLDAKRQDGSVEGGVEAGSSVADYVAHLEYGTVRAPAYPFMGPAGDFMVDNSRGAKILVRALRRKVKGKGKA